MGGTNYYQRYYRPALHPDDLHRVSVRIDGTCKTLAELTPRECRAVVERCLGSTQKARTLLSGIEMWDSVARFYAFNELAQQGKLMKVLVS